MGKINITSKNFLRKLAKLPPYDYDLRTSTGKVFQDIQLWDRDFKPFWIGNKVTEIYKHYKENPNQRGVFMLVGNNRKSYSRGKLKNIYVSTWNTKR